MAHSSLSRPMFFEVSFQALMAMMPMTAHESVDIRSGRSAMVEVIGVLVHVERLDRYAPRQCVGVIGRPLIDEGALTRLEAEQHPTRTAALCLAHRHELITPVLDAAEAADQRESHGWHHGRRFRRQPVEIQLVQQHRVGRDQLLALQAVEFEAGHASETCLPQCGTDRIEALHRTAVVVLVVASQQLLGKPPEHARVERQGLRDRVHGLSVSC